MYPSVFKVPSTESCFSLERPPSLSNIPKQKVPKLQVSTSLDFDIQSNLWAHKEETYPMTTVLLFKGIPEDLVEEEMLNLCKPFGVIKDIFVKKSARQAYIQFERYDQAQRCLESFSTFPAIIRRSQLYVYLTGKNEIPKPTVPSLPPSRFLLLVFHSIGFSIEANQVVQLLTPFGRCNKIVFLQSKNTQAIVEMDDVSQAMKAQEILDGQTIWNNVFLSVVFSDERECTQKNSFPPTISRMSTQATLDLSPLNSPGLKKTDSFQTIWNGSQETSFAWPPVGMANSTPQKFMMAPESFAKPKLYRFDSQDAFTHNPMEKVGYYMNNSLNHIREEKSATILLVKNLPTGLTARMLFRLFGFYGNVLKVKIFFKNPETALIEYQNSEQAELAKCYLNNCQLNGNQIVITNSKQGVLVDVSALKKNQESQYMGNYLNSPEHRYKFTGSKNHLNIVPPSRVIHLSNLCDDKDEEFYQKLFIKFAAVIKFQFMKGPEKMALMETDSIESSIKILMNFHNLNINGKFLKVSFSKYQKVKDL